MPSAAAKGREEQAIDDALSALRASAPGLTATVSGRPEDESGTGRWPAGLTVDAVLRLERNETAVDWATDVVTVTWDNRLRPAVEGIEALLYGELAKLATSHDRSVTVCFNPPKRHKDKGEAYAAAILSHVADVLAGAADSDFGPFATDPNTYIEIGQQPFIGSSSERVHLMYVLSDTPRVWEQLDPLAAAVRAKLEGQLKRAHDLGYPTMLILDMVGPGDLFGGANFLPSQATVTQRVTQEVIAHEHRGGSHCLDFACLLRADGASPVFGHWPQGLQV